MSKKSAIFQQVKIKTVGSSRFDLSHDVKLTFDMGQLVPHCFEVLPGDKLSLSCSSMMRFNPLIAPIMHRVKVKHEWFFVPNRIIWDDWEEWITGELEVLHPTVNTNTDYKSGHLADYLGYPTETGANNHDLIAMNVFPLAGYIKIWDDWYRNENLQTEKFTDVTAGDNPALFLFARQKPLHRNWMLDRNTSALPFAQKGDQVLIPLADTDVVLKGPGNTPNDTLLKDKTSHVLESTDPLTSASGSLYTGASASVIDPNGAWEVQNTASPVENLRRAFRLQEWLEINARAGTRYTEFLIGHYNQSNGDARLQRPELIGQTTHNMIISEVLATAEGTTNPIGEMAGHGIAVNKGYRHKYKIKDYGWCFCITSVTPFTAYENGIHKSLSRDSYLDYYIPSFQNIGEQEILNKELYVGDEIPTPETTDAVFGYTPRYSAYKYLNNATHGNFKGTAAGTIDFWHLGRQFTSQPNLNDDFVTCTPDTRIFAVEDPNINNIYAHLMFDISAVRKMAKYAIPGF